MNLLIHRPVSITNVFHSPPPPKRFTHHHHHVSFPKTFRAMVRLRARGVNTLGGGLATTTRNLESEYNSMIAACRLYDQMADYISSLDYVTFSVIFNGLDKKTWVIETKVDLMNWIYCTDIPTYPAYGILIENCSNTEFKNLVELVKGLCMRGLENAYDTMLQWNYKPDGAVYNLFILEHCNCGNVHKAYNMYMEMVHYGFAPHMLFVLALIGALISEKMESEVSWVIQNTLRSCDLNDSELLEALSEIDVTEGEVRALFNVLAEKTMDGLLLNGGKGFMGTSPDAGQLMALLLKVLNAKMTIEVGVFTGYSLLLTALSIPDDGKIVAVDPDREAYERGQSFIKKAGVEHKIDFIESPALPVLDKLFEDPSNEGTFDFAFVDADKHNYWNYHERLVKLVKIEGLIIYDNTLWGGTVAWPEEDVPAPKRGIRQSALAFNKAIAGDSLIEISVASVRDGFTMCRRAH